MGAKAEFSVTVPETAFHAGLFHEKDTRYKVLKFLYNDGPSYSARIAHYLKISTARACQVLKELERGGLIKSNSDYMKCKICEGTGRAGHDPARRCLICKGEGVVFVKSYPVFYEVAPEMRERLLRLFVASAGVREMVEEGEREK